MGFLFMRRGILDISGCGYAVARNQGPGADLTGPIPGWGLGIVMPLFWPFSLSCCGYHLARGTNIVGLRIVLASSASALQDDNGVDLLLDLNQDSRAAALISFTRVSTLRQNQKGPSHGETLHHRARWVPLSPALRMSGLSWHRS